MTKIQERPTNVLVVGVGGQGVILVSKVLAQLCLSKGLQVKQSEIHGMAKRGGTVFSHIRFGPQVWSPTIPAGEVDVLVALEWAEGLRWLEYLNPDCGTFISDTQHIVPPFACRNRQRGSEDTYARETPAEIIKKVPNGFALDAAGMAQELGNERTSNTILLGILSTTLDFEIKDWEETLDLFVPPKTVELNRQAFHIGRQWIENAIRTSEVAPVSELYEQKFFPEEKGLVEWEFIPEWCKGCDICVKMCPERCLKLTPDQKVEILDINDCTGCRICEWLCPDFAINIRKPVFIS
ncbi:MAG: 2-oxoacid:acceptor oxidoreductase family protein [SAR324 cluster bacterium]|nr:2-oxoacid:acceptor oxidoreductase family protein [SAR324 cluster bacterium]